MEEQKRAQEQGPLAKDASYRQTLPNPFAPGSVGEALDNAVKADKMKEKADAALEACRRKNSNTLRPGFDFEKFCPNELAEVRKYQEYREGWNDAAIKRSANDPAVLREKQMQQDREQIATARAAYEKKQKEAADAASAADADNPFSVRTAINNAKAKIQNVKDRVKACSTDLQNLNPFSKECTDDQ